MYKSKPHVVEAFQFKGKGTDTPVWFNKAVECGKASMTNNPKDNFITVYSEAHHEKALIDWWVIKSKHGKLYVLDDVSFKESYEETA